MLNIHFGNKTIGLGLGAATDWKGMRTYYEIIVEGKANPLSKFYEIHSGGSRDNTLEVNGRTFGYVYGFCDSKTKRKAVDEAVQNLAKELAA